tara:strand:+ start:1004 stop:1495 length:492 start_codon:yes stop_codon:yes gene_type:complete
MDIYFIEDEEKFNKAHQKLTNTKESILLDSASKKLAEGSLTVTLPYKVIENNGKLYCDLPNFAEVVSINLESLGVSMLSKENLKDDNSSYISLNVGSLFAFKISGLGTFVYMVKEATPRTDYFTALRIETDKLGRKLNAKINKAFKKQSKLIRSIERQAVYDL